MVGLHKIELRKLKQRWHKRYDIKHNYGDVGEL